MDYCPECGEEVEDDQDYCSNCGNKLTEEGSESPEEGKTETSGSTEQESKQEEQEASEEVNSPIKNNIGLIIVAGIAATAFGLYVTEQPLNEDLVSVENVEWTEPVPNMWYEEGSDYPLYYGEIQVTLQASTEAEDEFLVKVPSRPNDLSEADGRIEEYENVYLRPGETKEVTTILPGQGDFTLKLKRSVDGQETVTVRPEIRDPTSSELSELRN